VLMSLAVARMITPMVAAYFLKAKGEAEHAGGPWMERYLGVLHWSLDASQAHAYRAASRGTEGKLSYLDRLRARLRDHRIWMMGIGAGALALTGLLLAVLPMEFIPTTNNDYTA